MNEASSELEEFFKKFSSHYESRHLTCNQSENLKMWHGVKGCEGITLSQVDNWMYQAKIMPQCFGKNFSGEIFFRFK